MSDEPESMADALANVISLEQHRQKKRGIEPPLNADHCPKCQHIVRPFYRTCPKCEGDRNRARVEALAAVIREYKARPPARGDMGRAKKRLVDLGHPDADGFLGTLYGSQGKRGVDV